ncbi:hypothetical protein K501DRAFT_265779 [Backusella circina FSU 941]|nr:hypothetical protein K501DRAFT_265779 [Backusella circina FSU 941]
MMLTDEDQLSSRIFTCSQCPKIFATRSNLRDQKRWKGHSKKVVSKEETTERMRKWRAENREKNRQNDLRCRVYRLARQKYGDEESLEKQRFVRDEISRRLGRRMLMEKKSHWSSLVETPPPSPSVLLSPASDLEELPFYSVPQQKIELPSIDVFTRSTPPSPIPHLSPSLQRRTSSSSYSSHEEEQRSSYASPTTEDELCVLPSMHTFLSFASSAAEKERTVTTKGGIKYVESNKILDEFVGVVLNYAAAAPVK